MGVLDRFRLDGKRLFITGGSRGLGREMALAAADAGADVIIVGRDSRSLERTAGDVRDLGEFVGLRLGAVGKLRKGAVGAAIAAQIRERNK